VNHTIRCFHLLSCLEDFKMSREKGDLIIEGNGVRFNASHLSLEDGIVEAYIYIRANDEAKRLIQNAKITP
jgi:hypothetical protein